MFRLDDETGRLISSAWGYEPDLRFVLVKKEQRSGGKLLLTFACYSAYSDLSPKVYREAYSVVRQRKLSVAALWKCW
ncbi:MAG: hypothetical protein ACI4L5_06525 [Negativibacillus sp.]